jgi:hypothetical protein
MLNRDKKARLREYIRGHNGREEKNVMFGRRAEKHLMYGKRDERVKRCIQYILISQMKIVCYRKERALVIAASMNTVH